MVSKELLSAVFGIEIYTEISIQKENDDINGGELEYDMIYFNFTRYPLHYILYKVKEWALGQGYELRTSPRGVVDIYYVPNDYEFVDCRHGFDNEPDAIFESGEWILKIKNKNK